MGVQIIGFIYSLCFIHKLGKAKKVHLNTQTSNMNLERNNDKKKEKDENGEYFPIYTFNGPTRV